MVEPFRSIIKITTKEMRPKVCTYVIWCSFALKIIGDKRVFRFEFIEANVHPICNLGN